MNGSRSLPVALVALLVVGSAVPSLAGSKPKPKPKPITGHYTATAYPDPTSTLPTMTPCSPHSPVGKDSHPFTIPAKGTLHVELNNQLDWSIGIRDTDGTVEGTADGELPNVKESIDVDFPKKQPITIDACNFSGEPSVTVSYSFTYK